MTIIIDETTRRQFVRDYKLPIQIVKDGYFEYYLELFQEHFKSQSRYDLMLETVNFFGSLEAFNNEAKRIRHEAIDFVRANEVYAQLEKDKLTSYDCKFEYKINLYNQLNIGKTFVSIDLVKGNVQALNFYNKEILGNSDTYEDFMKKFTEHEYFIKSKQIRQVIFGNLLPKKQQKIQKFIMGIIRDELIKNGMNENDICASSPDEIVFELDAFKDFQKVLDSDIIKALNLHVEIFKLEKISDDVEGFIKVFQNKEGIELKKCNAKFMPEIIKFLKKEPLNEKDLCFFDEGRIAQYSQPLLKR